MSTTDPYDSHPHSIRPFSALSPSPIPWLWPHRLPLSQISLLVSRPGLGKGLLVADIAARISTASPWPDASPNAGSPWQKSREPMRRDIDAGPRSRDEAVLKEIRASLDDEGPESRTQAAAARLLPRAAAGSVILISREDDPAQVIRPRLLAHGADLSKIHVLTVLDDLAKSTDTPELFFNLENYGPLVEALQTLPDCKLVVFDPIAAFFSTGDLRHDSKIRRCFSSLFHLAQRHGPAILLVHHPKKRPAPTADQSVLGGSALTSISRNVWHLLQDPQNPSRRLLLPGKSNLSQQPPGLSFTITDSKLPEDISSPLTPLAQRAPRIIWDPEPLQLTADDPIPPKPKLPFGPEPIERKSAETWLKTLLSPGPLDAQQIRQESESAGLIYRTVQRAADHLNIQRDRSPTPGQWTWKLPDD